MTYVRQTAFRPHVFLQKGGTFEEGGAKRWKALEKDYKKHPQFVPVRRLAEENEPCEHDQNKDPSWSFFEKKSRKSSLWICDYYGLNAAAANLSFF